jgi:hypothetical protein
MRNVIEMPQKKVQNGEFKDRTEAQKIFLSLALVVLVVTTVMTQDQKLASDRPVYVTAGDGTDLRKLNRAIASANPGDLISSLEIERKLAQKLRETDQGLDARIPASASGRVSAIEELRFGELAGKYAVTQRVLPNRVDALIERFEYIESADIADRPLFVKPEQFLQKYRQALAVPFADAKRTAQSPREEIYSLFDEQRNPLGTAHFELNEEGRLLRFRVSELQ